MTLLDNVERQLEREDRDALGARLRIFILILGSGVSLWSGLNQLGLPGIALSGAWVAALAAFAEVLLYRRN